MVDLNEGYRNVSKALIRSEGQFNMEGNVLTRSAKDSGPCFRPRS